MKTTIVEIDGIEIHSPHFWETPPQPLPLPVICIGSVFIGAVLTLLFLVH